MQTLASTWKVCLHAGSVRPTLSSAAALVVSCLACNEGTNPLENGPEESACGVAVSHFCSTLNGIFMAGFSFAFGETAEARASARREIVAEKARSD